MNVSTIESNPYNPKIAALQYDKLDTRQKVPPIPNSTEKNTDSIQISDEAKAAQEKSKRLKGFSEKAHKMLKKRGLPDEDIEAFQKLITDAKQAANAKDFLKSLSEENRDIVKKANSYGHDLKNNHIDGMSEEGATNMLVQPDNRSRVDLNNDGLAEIGQGTLFQFPPPNASDQVKDAWDKTMESIPEKEQGMASHFFMPLNLKINSKGEVSKAFNNPFPNDINGWASSLDEIDRYLDYAEIHFPEYREQHLKDRHINNTFRKNLFS